MGKRGLRFTPRSRLSIKRGKEEKESLESRLFRSPCKLHKKAQIMASQIVFLVPQKG